MRVFTDLEDLLNEAAAGPDIKKYLLARGIKTIGTLALVAKDEEALARHIITPLTSGWGSGSDAVTIPRDEQPIAAAVLLHAWTLARTSWAKTLAASTPSPGPATPASLSLGASPTSTSESKVPKNLPAGKWTELVNSYNAVTVAGRPRSFPVREILGAECVIARLWHEKHVSQLFSPLLLGEILQHRSFTASGDINPLAKTGKKQTALSLDEDRQLVETEEQTWSPRSVLSVLDGITACRWAFTLVQYGEEEEIVAFCNLMQQRARSRPDKMEHMTAYWHASMWKICMAMRSGETFGAASKPIMDDMESFHDYMNKDINSIRPKSKVPVKPENTDKQFGKAGKGGKSGKSSNSYVYRQAPTQRQRWGPYDQQRWHGRNQQYDNRWQQDHWSSNNSWQERQHK